MDKNPATIIVMQYTLGDDSVEQIKQLEKNEYFMYIEKKQLRENIIEELEK